MHTLRTFALAATVVVAVAAPGIAGGQTRMRKVAFSGGALDVSAGAYRLRGTLGEVGFVGRVGAGGVTLAEGFWPGQYVVAGVVDAPLPEGPVGSEGVRYENGLRQNRPNPFKDSTTITYVVGRRAPVRLDIFDVSGRRVATLADLEQDPGVHGVTWNGLDRSGRRVGTGIYFYRLRVGGWSATKRLSKLD